MYRFKQWLKLFFLAFSLFFAWLGVPPINNYDTYRAIAKAPAETIATRHEVIALDNKKPPQRLYIRFYYQVDGKEYMTKTTTTNPEGIGEYLAESPVAIAYVAGKPHIATLKRYFDLNYGKESLWQLLVVGILATLMFALPISLLLMPLVWFVRERHDIRADLPPPPVKSFLANTLMIYVVTLAALLLIFKIFAINREIAHSIMPLLFAIFVTGCHMSERHGRFYHNREKAQLVPLLLALFIASQYLLLAVRKLLTGLSLPLPPLDFTLMFFNIMTIVYSAMIFTALDGVTLYHARRKP